MAIATPPISAARVNTLIPRGGEEVQQPGARAEPLTDEVEDRPAGDRHDPAGHLRVQADADRAGHQNPQQADAEAGAGDAARHHIADVDVAADRGEDAQREPEHLTHPMLTRCSSSGSSGPQRLELGEGGDDRRQRGGLLPQLVELLPAGRGQQITERAGRLGHQVVEFLGERVRGGTQ